MELVLLILPTQMSVFFSDSRAGIIRVSQTAPQQFIDSLDGAGSLDAAEVNERLRQSVVE